jgi:hypothetical protein
MVFRSTCKGVSGMKKYLALSSVLGCSLLALSISALAQTSTSGSSTMSDNSGIYLGAGAGWGEEASVDHIGSNKGFVWNANGGYQFNSNVAAELGFIGYPSNKLKYNSVSETLHFYNTYLAVKGMYPFADVFNVYAKVGPSYAYSSASGNLGSSNMHAWTAYGALGLGYNFTPALQADVQVDGTLKRNDVKNSAGGVKTDMPALYSTTVGLSYLFNM